MSSETSVFFHQTSNYITKTEFFTLTAVRTSHRYGHKLHKEAIYLEDKDMEMHISLYLWLYSPCGPWPLY
jgi:hypothetical protein